MSDLASVLRDSSRPGQMTLRRRAADEIERLQEENKLLRLERDFNRDNAMAEIERLNAVNTELNPFNTELCKLLKQMHHVMALCVTALAKCG